MNGYDFDGTIYDGDSTLDFYRFCVKRRPRVLTALPRQGWAVLRYLLKRRDKTAMKQGFYSFLGRLDDTESLVAAFWQTHQAKVKSWYLAQKRADDAILSASPAFLLEPICARLETGELIASQVDPQTGRCLGDNCYGSEKARRFSERFPGQTMENFYSDTLSDLPAARLAERAWLVRGREVRPWPLEKEEGERA